MELVDRFGVPGAAEQEAVDDEEIGRQGPDLGRDRLLLRRSEYGARKILGRPGILRSAVETGAFAGEERVVASRDPLPDGLDHLVEAARPVGLPGVREEDGREQGVAAPPVVDRGVSLGVALGLPMPAEHDGRLLRRGAGDVDRHRRLQVDFDGLALPLGDDDGGVVEGNFDDHGRGPAAKAGSFSWIGLMR